ncbi:MAG TPA: hypothetical protein VLL49_12140 [Anaerolineales bacterium]|nr:hypothetical protein [Anaerolineales bacterium]
MSLLKPTLQTPFHIDFDWWEQKDRDWHVFLRSLLCPDHQQSLAEVAEDALIDWVDPKTAEVKQVDGIQHILMHHCALQPEFTNRQTTVVEAVFRLMLVNGNQPLNAAELGERLGRPAETILRTLAGTRVYRGIRPVVVSEAGTAVQPAVVSRA